MTPRIDWHIIEVTKAVFKSYTDDGKDLSVYEIMSGKKTVSEVLTKTNISGLDIIPSDIDLASAEVELVNTVGRETILKFNLEGMLGAYDYVTNTFNPIFFVY